jgi:hypothetical protein
VRGPSSVIHLRGPYAEARAPATFLRPLLALRLRRGGLFFGGSARRHDDEVAQVPRERRLRTAIGLPTIPVGRRRRGAAFLKSTIPADDDRQIGSLPLERVEPTQRPPADDDFGDGFGFGRCARLPGPRRLHFGGHALGLSARTAPPFALGCSKTAHRAVEVCLLVSDCVSQLFHDGSRRSLLEQPCLAPSRGIWPVFSKSHDRSRGSRFARP